MKCKKSHLFLLWTGKNLYLDIPESSDARCAALALGTAWLQGNWRARVRPELPNLFLGWAWYLPASEATQQAEVVGSPLAGQGMIAHTAKMSTYIFTGSWPVHTWWLVRLEMQLLSREILSEWFWLAFITDIMRREMRSICDRALSKHYWMILCFEGNNSHKDVFLFITLIIHQHWGYIYVTKCSTMQKLWWKPVQPHPGSRTPG